METAAMGIKWGKKAKQMEMTDNKKSSTKRAKYNNFGELLYYAYANLQMLCYALGSNTPKYDKKCYMIRAKAYKAYKEAEMEYPWPNATERG